MSSSKFVKTPSNSQTRNGSEMEIPAWIFFSFCSFTGVFSLYLGMESLNRTDLPTSVSPKILFFFKHSFATAACHSSTYASVFRPKMKIRAPTYYVWFAFAIFPITFATNPAGCFPIYTVFNISVVIFYFLPWTERSLGPTSFYYQSIAIALIPLLSFLSRSDSYLTIFISNFIVFYHIHFAAVEEEQFGLMFHYYTMTILFLLLGCFTPLVLLSAFFTLLLQRWLAAAVGEDGGVFAKVKKKMMKKKGTKVIEFAIGMAGAILFQSFFRLSSWDHVAAFLFLAVAWLANLALLLCPFDLGFLNFLLGNAIVGCVVSQLGPRMVYASVFLYVLRVKMELVCVVERGEAKAAVVGWGENQITGVESCCLFNFT